MSVFAQSRLLALPQAPQLIIYDCDGVLIDSEAIANRLVSEALSNLGWKISPADCGRKFLGLTFDDMCPLIENELGRALPEGWLDRFLAHVVMTMEREAEPIPGARTALEVTAQLGVEWRVASNSSHEEMAAKFFRVGFLDLVEGRLHSAQDVVRDGGRAKPAPDLFLAVAQEAGVDPTNCVVIEDSPTGIRAAVAAGMTCLALCRHGGADTAMQLGAVPFDAMDQIPDLLRVTLERPM